MALQKNVKRFFGLIVAANLVIVLMVVIGGLEPAPRKPLPNPNGYDDFVRAGTLIIGNAGDFSTMKQPELAALVATNAEALKALRVGLSRESRAPDDYSRHYFDQALPELASQKKLALNLCAEGRLAIMEKRTNDAVQSYLDTIRFGQQCSQGGVMISKLVGIACENLGRQGLQPLSYDLDSQACVKIAQILETLDATESSLDEILEHESALLRKGNTLRQKITLLITYTEQQRYKAHVTAKFHKNQLEQRQLMIDLAARACRLDQGKPPATITNLIPTYLKAIPKDPVTGTNLAINPFGP